MFTYPQIDVYDTLTACKLQAHTYLSVAVSIALKYAAVFTAILPTISEEYSQSIFFPALKKIIDFWCLVKTLMINIY